MASLLASTPGVPWLEVLSYMRWVSRNRFTKTAYVSSEEITALTSSMEDDGWITQSVAVSSSQKAYIVTYRRMGNDEREDMIKSAHAHMEEFR